MNDDHRALAAPGGGSAQQFADDDAAGSEGSGQEGQCPVLFLAMAVAEDAGEMLSMPRDEGEGDLGQGSVGWIGRHQDVEKTRNATTTHAAAMDCQRQSNGQRLSRQGRDYRRQTGVGFSGRCGERRGRGKRWAGGSWEVGDG
jgi:hypothetical protein